MNVIISDITRDTAARTREGMAHAPTLLCADWTPAGAKAPLLDILGELNTDEEEGSPGRWRLCGERRDGPPRVLT